MPAAPAGLAAGEPLLVRMPSGEEAYWLVPGHTAEGVRALARVLLDGRIASVGATHRPEEDAAAAATGLGARGAAAWTPAGAAAPPALVCDGPVGREAWFVRIVDGASERWVFATGGGQYERPAGTPPRGGIVD